jgi:hypothetical protein
MIEDLEKAWSKVASAKASAMSAWIEWRANWWYVSSWTPYIVWENWPELFVPRGNWTIVPNNEITNNNWITINMSWITVREEADIQRIADEIIRQTKLEKNYWITS